MSKLKFKEGAIGKIFDTNFQNLEPFIAQRTEYSIHYKNFNECLIEANEYFNTLP